VVRVRGLGLGFGTRGQMSGGKMPHIRCALAGSRRSTFGIVLPFARHCIIKSAIHTRAVGAGALMSLVGSMNGGYGAYFVPPTVARCSA